MTKPTMLDKAAKATREILFEPYNANNPTWTDKAVKFSSDVLYPDLNDEQRRQYINQAKPWWKVGWTLFGLFDGHLLTAALPWLFGARRRRKAPLSVMNWDKLDSNWSDR